MEKYILAIDQSTTATKAILFGLDGSPKSRCDVPHRQYRPKEDWVEHDPVEIYENVLSAIKGVLEKSRVTEDQVLTIAVTNQRETTIVWNEQSGLPVYNAIVWQCNRGADIVRNLCDSGYDRQIEYRTGMKLAPYFSAVKAKWIVDNIRPQGRLMFGTVDSWLVWKLTGEHVTDYSNASRTQLFNISTLEWDRELIAYFGLEKLKMPKVICSDEIAGYTTANGIFKKEIPVAGIIGDSQGALFGQLCFKPGSAKATLGTGTSVMLNIGDKPIRSDKGLVTSIGWGIRDGFTYVFEGNINSTGDTIKWIVENLGILEKSSLSEECIRKTEGNQGVYIVPAFAGFGAPYWNSEAKASIYGLTKSANRNHIVRAGVESIAYQIKDIVLLMLEEMKTDLYVLRVDGGATGNAWLMQFMADILQTKIVKNSIEELSALGAAFLAGMAVGIWKNNSEMENLCLTDETYTPGMSESEMNRLYTGWKSAVEATLFHATKKHSK